MRKVRDADEDAGCRYRERLTREKSKSKAGTRKTRENATDCCGRSTSAYAADSGIYAYYDRRTIFGKEMVCMLHAV